MSQRPIAPWLSSLVALLITTPAIAAPVFQRTPNLDDTATVPEGTSLLELTHRLILTGAKFSNFPTLTLGIGLPWETGLGGKFATNAATTKGVVVDWEVTLAKALLHQEQHWLDLGVKAGYNGVANSGDGELNLARTLGPVRLMAALRGFSNGYRLGPIAAVGAGLNIKLFPHLALAADVSRTLNTDHPLAWGAGIQAEIPYTPHSLSFQVSNVNATTMEGSSIGSNLIMWGFEFTVPFNMWERWVAIFRDPPPDPEATGSDASGSPAAAAP
jgi:hypothetical protein